MAKTVKTGYDGALEFDPASGVIKYGNYEFFADQVGVKPQNDTFTFEDYKKSFGSEFFGGAAASVINDAAMRKKFEADVSSGMLRVAKPPENNTASILYGPQLAKGPYERIDDTKTAWGGQVVGFEQSKFRNISQVNPDTYSVSTYDVPQDIEFINNLNKRAADLNANAALGQVTDSSRPTPGNARLGKPNFSRAASILAGEQSPLGGAKTSLGS